MKYDEIDLVLDIIKIVCIVVIGYFLIDATLSIPPEQIFLILFSLIIVLLIVILILVIVWLVVVLLKEKEVKR